MGGGTMASFAEVGTRTYWGSIMNLLLGKPHAYVGMQVGSGLASLGSDSGNDYLRWVAEHSSSPCYSQVKPRRFVEKSAEAMTCTGWLTGSMLKKTTPELFWLLVDCATHARVTRAHGGGLCPD